MEEAMKDKGKVWGIMVYGESGEVSCRIHNAPLSSFTLDSRPIFINESRPLPASLFSIMWGTCSLLLFRHFSIRKNVL